MDVTNISKQGNKFAMELLKSFCERSKMLLENEAVLAALYLDPRFNFEGSLFLSESDKQKAKVRLEFVYIFLSWCHSHVV
jgi:hypothetical protein